MFRMGNQYHLASMELAKKSQKDMELTVTKTIKAQESYLRKNANLYTHN